VAHKIEELAFVVMYLLTKTMGLQIAKPLVVIIAAAAMQYL
jgi:hypothetical protein